MSFDKVFDLLEGIDDPLADKVKAALKEAIKQQGEPVAWSTPNPKTVNDFSFYATKVYTEPLYTSAQTIPEGWKLVPVEPTATQIRCGQLGVTTTCAISIYQAMLSAAPEYKGEE